MLVDYLYKIPKKKKFYYGIVLVICIWFFNTAYIPTLSFIVALVIGIALIYYDNEKILTDSGNTNTDLDYKLNSLLEEENRPVPEFLYIEPDFINFFYSIKDFRIYNRDAYVKSIKITNNLLKLKKDLDNDFFYNEYGKKEAWQNFGFIKLPVKKNNIKNLKEIFETCELLGFRALNYIQSFSINLPANYKKKHKDALSRFHLLMKRVLDDILIHSKKHSNNPLIGQYYGLPKPHAENQSYAEKRFNFY